MKCQVLVILVLLSGTLGDESTSPGSSSKPSSISSSQSSSSPDTTSEASETAESDKTTQVTTTEAPSPPSLDDCAKSCPSPRDDRFCHTDRDANCECVESCCELPKCEYGIDWGRCYDCKNCECFGPPSDSIESSDSSPSPSCPQYCEVPDSRFCEAWQNPGECECHVECCQPPNCPNGIDWEHCHGCNDCLCIGSSESSESSSDSEQLSDSSPSPSCPDFCVSPSIFCEAWKNPGDCECNVECCREPFCPNGIDWERCRGCNECPCIDVIETVESTPSNCDDPCPSSESAFCEIKRNQNCVCEERCCELPLCEFGVDFNRCSDCNNCECLPEPSSSSTHFSSEESSSDSSPSPSCSQCENPSTRFCEVWQNPRDCECHVECCQPPSCPNGIDYEHCNGCNDCPCVGETSPLSFESSPDETSSDYTFPSTDCATPCEQPGDTFCFATQDPNTCECYVACCSPPFCENGVDWAHCSDCFNCPCLNNTPNCTETCPCSDKRFCDYVQEENCDCTEVCCEPPLCEGLGVDWKNCESCSNCPCLSPSNSEPCDPPSTSPSPDCNEPCPSSDSNFCFGMRDDFCECQTVCCAPPECPETGVNWSECVSCSHCPCLPPPSASHECDHD